MNLESLNQRIRDPRSIEQGEIQALKDLTAKYPFAQLYSLLYLKGLAQHQQLNFEEELQGLAYRITDRARLFDLLQEKTEPGLSDHSEAEIQLSEPEISLPEPEMTLIDLAAEREEVKDLEPEPETAEEAVVSTAGSDELEKEILAHIAASAYSLELEEKEAEQELKTSKPALDTTSERSFTSWLKLAGESGLKAKDNTDKTREIIDQLKDLEKPKDAEQTSPEKKAFFSASKTARESVQEDKLIYSETLANIFAMQGNYPKAILAFQQLMLTNPEKKLYFAKKIKELKLKLDT